MWLAHSCYLQLSFCWYLHCHHCPELCPVLWVHSSWVVHRKLRPTIALAYFHTLFWWKLRKNVESSLVTLCMWYHCIQNITQLRFLFLHYWEIVAFTIRWTSYLLNSLLSFHQHLRWGFCGLATELGIVDIGEQDWQSCTSYLWEIWKSTQTVDMVHALEM